MSDRSTRQGFGRGIFALAAERQDILVASADTFGTFSLDAFVAAFPDRFYEFGISEQNMIAACAGMATEGYTVFCVGYSPFLSMRALEQIRTFVAYPNLKVNIVAGLSGLAGETNGVTHQGTEDIPIIRSIPNMSLFCPADAVAAERLVKTMVDSPGPAYFRLGRSPTPLVYPETQKFPASGSLLPRDYGDDLVIMTAGPCVQEAVAAADLLAREGIGIKVLDLFRIKPLDAAAVIELAGRTGQVITVEDGNIMGGLGGAVAETLMDSGTRCAFRRLGLKGFGTAGTLAELLTFFGLDASGIRREALAMLRGGTGGG